MSQLPEGFVLNEESAAAPGLPEGFVLDGAEQAAPQQPYQGGVLPFSTDERGGIHFDSDAGILGGIKRAITLPQRVYEGKVDPRSEEGQGEALNLAGLGITAPPGGVFARSATPALTRAAPPAVKPAANEVVEAATRLSTEGAPVNVPYGVSSDSPAVQAAFQRGKQTPGATGVVERSLDDFYTGVEVKVGEVAQKAAGSEIKEQSALGASVRQSLERAIEKSEGQADEAFSVMRRAIDPERPVKVLDDSVVRVLDRVKANRAGAGEADVPPQLAAAFRILEDPNGVTFNGIQRARSQIGRAIKWDASQGGFNAGDMKQVYGALTQAMESAASQTAKSSSEGAVKLLKAADARYAKMAEDNKVLGSVLRRDADESLVNSIIGMASAKSGNARKLEAILKEVGPEGRGEISGFVIQGMGKGRDGNFSATAFANNWQKLSTTGKAQLFKEAKVRQALDDIAIITKRMSEAQKKFDNSSRTAGALGQGLAGAGLVADPVTTIATILGANVAARVLAKPTTAQTAARFSKALEAKLMRPTRNTMQAANDAADAFAKSVYAQTGVKIEAAQLLSAANDSAPSGSANRTPATARQR